MHSAFLAEEVVVEEVEAAEGEAEGGQAAGQPISSCLGGLPNKN